MTDRYSKIVLTVIAGALVYLCVVMTALPAAQAQGTLRPGEPSGPQEVVVVGWRPTTPLPIIAPEPLRVITQQGSGIADRVILTGWEENDRGTSVERRINAQTLGLPVVVRTK